MTKLLSVAIAAELLDMIFESARRLYPKETILLLRGKKKKDSVNVTELVVPPLATYGHSFASMPLHMLPIDYSIVGTVHSHPSGNVNASMHDFNHFFGSVLMIAGFPFVNESNIAVYNSHGEKLTLHILRS